ncbi:MAG: hypothetical protein SNJ64_04105 [Endomicrobiia bacterium]
MKYHFVRVSDKGKQVISRLSHGKLKAFSKVMIVDYALFALEKFGFNEKELASFIEEYLKEE